MKMKKLTAMGMAALMAATMIPAVPVMAEGEGKVYPDHQQHGGGK